MFKSSNSCHLRTCFGHHQFFPRVFDLFDGFCSKTVGFGKVRNSRIEVATESLAIVLLLVAGRNVWDFQLGCYQCVRIRSGMLHLLGQGVISFKCLTCHDGVLDWYTSIAQREYNWTRWRRAALYRQPSMHVGDVHAWQGWMHRWLAPSQPADPPSTRSSQRCMHGTGRLSWVLSA